MATFGAMINRIVEELPRGDTSITAIVQAQLLTAVEFYTNERFWFNEKQTTLTTSSSLAYYAWPTDLIEIDQVTAYDSSGTSYELEPITYQQMSARDYGNTFGQPFWYSTYGKQFRLYPVPNGTYTFVVSHQYSPATLSASTDSNPWTTDAETLIRARTLKNCAARFKDFDAARLYEEMERQELDRLKRQTEKLLSTNELQGSGF